MKQKEEILKQIIHDKMWLQTDGKHAHESNHDFVRGFISGLEWVISD